PVEQRERQADQQADFSIAKLQVALDRFDQQGNDPAIDVVQHVDEGNDADRVPGGASRRKRLRPLPRRNVHYPRPPPAGRSTARTKGEGLAQRAAMAMRLAGWADQAT